MSRPHVVARYVVAVSAVSAVAAFVGVPASAVQTATFGLAATGARTKIVHPAQNSPILDSVVVYNRTSKPIAVSLDVVGVTQQADRSYSLGASGTGLASRVRLARRSVRLAGRARQVVGVTIDPPDDVKTPSYAAVTAVAGRGPSTGVDVTERLAVLVGITPSSDASATTHTTGATHTRTVAVVIATVLLLALLAILIAAFALRRRRQPAADGTP